MASQPKRILIVEDEKPLARALELKLLNSGFRPRIAVDGQEALDYLKKEKFDLILLDLVIIQGLLPIDCYPGSKS